MAHSWKCMLVFRKKNRHWSWTHHPSGRSDIWSAVTSALCTEIWPARVLEATAAWSATTRPGQGSSKLISGEYLIRLYMIIPEALQYPSGDAPKTVWHLQASQCFKLSKASPNQRKSTKRSEVKLLGYWSQVRAKQYVDMLVFLWMLCL